MINILVSVKTHSKIEFSNTEAIESGIKAGRRWEKIVQESCLFFTAQINSLLINS